MVVLGKFQDWQLYCCGKFKENGCETKISCRMSSKMVAKMIVMRMGGGLEVNMFRYGCTSTCLIGL